MVKSRNLDERLHSEKRKAVAKEDKEGIGVRDDLLNKGKVGFESEGLEDEAVAIPDAEAGRGRGGRGGLLDGEVEELCVAQSVKVLGVENGGSGLEGLAGDVDGGDSASDDGAALEDTDVEGGGGVAAEEVGERGASDAAADDADSGR